ncbi:MAG: methyltransferase domain-containing protein [Anaerolineales bacterium]|nr:methyltransferase domain-containing protein [Anaerolineales bacterium]
MERNEIEKKQRVAKFFGELSAPGWGLDDHFFKAMGLRLVENAAVAEGHQVLDVAAGRGASLFPAAERVGPQGRVIGIDIAEPMVRGTMAEIQQRDLKNAEMHLMDAEDIKYPDETFDRVLCGFALFFFPDHNRALSEILRVLKPGGLFVTSTFSEGGYPWYWVDDLLKEHQISDRMDQLLDLVTQDFERPSEFEESFNATGFSNIEIFDESYIVTFANESHWWDAYLASADRALFEGLDPETLDRFKTDVMEILKSKRQHEGIQGTYRVLFAVGTKP